MEWRVGRVKRGVSFSFVEVFVEVFFWFFLVRFFVCLCDLEFVVLLECLGIWVLCFSFWVGVWWYMGLVFIGIV